MTEPLTPERQEGVKKVFVSLFEALEKEAIADLPWQEHALLIIQIIDYDLYKECKAEMDDPEYGFNDTVIMVVGYLKKHFQMLDKQEDTAENSKVEPESPN